MKKTWLRFIVVLFILLASPDLNAFAQEPYITFSNGTLGDPINSDEVAFFKNMVMTSTFDEATGTYNLDGRSAIPSKIWGTLSATYDPKTYKVTGEYMYVIWIPDANSPTESYVLEGTMSGEVNYMGGAVLTMTGVKRHSLRDEIGEIKSQETTDISRWVTFAVNGAVLPTAVVPTQPILEDSGARFSDMSGTVEVLIPIGVDENGQEIYDEEAWNFAKLEMVLPVGTMIKTGENSKVILSFADMTTFETRPNSTVILSSSAAKNRRLVDLIIGDLLIGGWKKALKGEIEVTASQAVLGTKGTIFAVHDDGVTTTLKVIEGTVESTSKATGQTELVSAGEMITADSTGLQPKTTFDVALESAQWESLAQPPAQAPVTVWPPLVSLALIGAVAIGFLVIAAGLVFSVTKRRQVARLGGGAALLGVCCLSTSLVVLAYPYARQYLDGIGSGGPPVAATATTPISAQSLMEEPTPAPAELASPSATLPSVSPFESLAPTTVLPTLAPQVFRDDFSDLSTGWLQVDDDVRLVGYSEGAMYAMAIKQPGNDVEVVIPHGFTLPLSEVEVYFRARPVEGEGYFGVMCNYVDTNNHTLIGVLEGAYIIYNEVNGEFTPLLGEQLGLQDSGITAENGEFQVRVVCGGDKIQLMVNGYSIPAVNNPGMAGGDIALFSHANTDATLEWEFFYKVLIDDLELTAR